MRSEEERGRRRKGEKVRRGKNVLGTEEKECRGSVKKAVRM